MSHEAFMRRAIELSAEGMAKGSGGPFGAVVVKDGEIIGEGYNRVLETNDPTAHAEVTAIRNAAAALGQFSLEGCDMYCIGLSCPMCMASLFWARIDRLYYVLPPEEAEDIGFDDKYFFEQLALPIEQREVPIIQMKELWDDARTVYQSWKTKDDKTPY
ncbi:MAG: nucleoside deaminase [Alphaproteobacteria bacterium]|nr:nucleoside deaminase [Alphaproteobacteria bacterium]